MPRRIVYHVIPAGGIWRVVKEGAGKASARADRKVDAIVRAKELAKAQPLGQVIIHKQDGTIQTEHTYGWDPERYRS